MLVCIALHLFNHGMGIIFGSNRARFHIENEIDKKDDCLNNKGYSDVNCQCNICIKKELKCKNGSVYSGDKRYYHYSNSCRWLAHGSGMCIWKNGCVLTAHFAHGFPLKGEIKYIDNIKYVGEFSNCGLEYGNCEIIWNENFIFKGKIIKTDNYSIGNGQLKWSNFPHISMCHFLPKDVIEIIISYANVTIKLEFSNERNLGKGPKILSLLF